VTSLRGLPDRHRALALELLRSGWTLARTRGGHYRLTHPGGAFVVMSRSPSDRRGIANLRSLVRRIESQARADVSQEKR
jgi:predicted RNA binding protein YcfA (HicA-like mRNA interferase family)